MATNRRLITTIRRRGGLDRDALVERHVRHILGEIMSARLRNTLRVTVELRATTLGHGNRGECHFRDELKTSTARSKHFTIRVKRDLGNAQLLRTLTHELCHLNQMATGRLAWKTRGRKGSKRGGYAWRPVGHTGGAIFTAIEDMPAWSLRPWEKEALAMEDRFHGPK
jgi:hypothetical protein